jgi:EAL domain-containing protein (putative c-di-GMP-specific phosphodiesterase class I)
MKQLDNLIAFPAIAVPSATPGDLSLDSPSAVIDFASRRKDLREAALNRDPLAAVELTPGEVWDALNEGRFEMHYQPQYDMRTGETVSVEALIRLVDLDEQLVYPDRFISQVEEGDLIVPLGRAVIERVCADLAESRAAGFAIERVAINLSSHQLNIDSGLVTFIDQTIARYGLAHADLEFELTERQRLTPQCEGLEVLNELAARGVRIVLDDFGIGYSSIVYLAQLPVTAFKLDRVLVRHLPGDKTMQALVESLLMLARTLDLEIIAEGIETQAQHEYLLRAGCPYAQGFGYAKPMNLDSLKTFLAGGEIANESRPLS